MLGPSVEYAAKSRVWSSPSGRGDSTPNIIDKSLTKVESGVLLGEVEKRRRGAAFGYARRGATSASSASIDDTAPMASCPRRQPSSPHHAAIIMSSP